MQDYETCYLVERVCDQRLHILILPLKCWMNIDESKLCFGCFICIN